MRATFPVVGLVLVRGIGIGTVRDLENKHLTIDDTMHGDGHVATCSEGGQGINFKAVYLWMVPDITGSDRSNVGVNEFGPPLTKLIPQRFDLR
jgi:hypothetical protein